MIFIPPDGGDSRFDLNEGWAYGPLIFAACLWGFLIYHYVFAELSPVNQRSASELAKSRYVAVEYRDAMRDGRISYWELNQLEDLHFERAGTRAVGLEPDVQACADPTLDRRNFCSIW